jgi:opacity protein-like surface antigen
MRIRVVGMGMAISLLLGASHAHATSEEGYARKGFHVSLLAEFAIPTWEDELRREIAVLDPTIPAADLKFSGGFDLRGGYRLNSRVAAEMGFEWVAPYAVEIDKTRATTLSSWMFYVDAKIYILTEQIQPYLLLGMGAYHLDFIVPTVLGLRDATSFSPRLGGGVDYYFTDHVGFTSEVNYVIGTHKINERNRVAVEFGLFYRF